MSRGNLVPVDGMQDLGMTDMAKATMFGDSVLELGSVTVQASTVKAAYGDASGVTAVVEELSPEERDRLLLEHLPTVRFLARRIHERLPQHVDVEDLISAGVVGLIDAFSKFDHSKKVQFKSYAQFRIRGAILDSLRRWTGARVSCGVRAGPWKRLSARRRSGLGALRRRLRLLRR